MQMKKFGRWKVDKIIWLSVHPAEMMADLSQGCENKRTAEYCGCLKLEKNNYLKTELAWCFCDLGWLYFKKKVIALHLFSKVKVENSRSVCDVMKWWLPNAAFTLKSENCGLFHIQMRLISYCRAVVRQGNGSYCKASIVAVHSVHKE